VTNSETLYCYIHPNRPTVLRCNRCERPICTEDAIRVPTGYRCPNCVREQQKVFDTAQWRDYVAAFVVAAIGSAIASGLVFRQWLLRWAIFSPPPALIGNLVLSANTGGARRRYSPRPPPA
jgi:hypothetical protein